MSLLRRLLLVGGATVAVLSLALLLSACSQSGAELVQPVAIAEGEYDPAVWGKAYPLEYDLWLKTQDDRPAGESTYKRGSDGGVTYDKLSEFPYLALLFQGWGFGIEYNEPRGHYSMLTDQLEVDAARVKAGGVCLTCKSPYAPALEKELGVAYFIEPYQQVHARIPGESQKLGVACIDCHDNDSMALTLTRPALTKALALLGDEAPAGHQQMRSLVCAQCHVSYMIEKDADMKSVGLAFPWVGSKAGAITVENVIKAIQSDPAYAEWTQKVTGFKLGFIRHPEYELFSAQSTHAQAGLACADCHMPYVRVGNSKVSDHNVMSPLKNGLRACSPCHPQSSESLKARVLAIQDRTASLFNRAGYATATVAKLFERVHQAQKKGTAVDPALHDQAKSLYEQAFYRTIFVGAENSMGFHNSQEAERICGDAVAFAGKAEALLRQALAQAGEPAPVPLDLELSTYLTDRGSKKLGYQPGVERADPFGLQELLLPRDSLGLPTD